MKKLTFLAFFLTFIFTAHAEDTQIVLTPEELTQYCEDISLKQEIFMEGIGRVDIQELSDFYPSYFSDESLPSSFDATKEGWVTPVKNQRQYGTCWAFSSISAMETGMIKKGFSKKNYTDFSELHLSYFAHKKNEKTGDGVTEYTSNYGYYGGGHTTHASRYLAGWQGPAKESDFPYPPQSKDYTLPEAERYTSLAHLQNSFIIPRNITAIKQAILEYGSVTVSYYDKKDYYSVNNAFYQNAYTSQNHAVTIVGWDDNYSLSNFEGLEDIPSAPGAWKVKNSWGAAWGDEGYFWMSYEEPSMSYFTVFDAEKADNYHIINQYDGASHDYYFSGNAAANVFTATENQTLNAVGFYTGHNLVEYRVKIYKLNDSFSSPEDGLCMETVSGYEPYIGYHTVTLENPVSLQKGDAFSIVLELGNNYYAFEGPSASSESKESYILTKSEWKTDYTYNGITKANNACIKAYSCKEKFTVSFDSSGGSSIPPSEVFSGFPLDIPPIPQKADKYFAGWYKDSSFSEIWNFDTDTVSEDITLYAKWSDTPIPVEAVTLSAPVSGIYINEQLEITPVFTPYYATNTSLNFTTSSENLTFSEGKVTGSKNGTYALTATTADGTNLSASFTVNVYDYLKNVTVRTTKPIYKTTDKIIYGITAENAVTYDFYIITPENKRYELTNAPSVFSLGGFNYTEGEYKIFAVAFDAFGDAVVGSEKSFWVTDSPMLIAQKIPDGYRIGGYNKTASKLFIAYYSENQLISLSVIDTSDTLTGIKNNPDATALKLIWLDSYNNLTPVTKNITIENPGEIPENTIFISKYQ